MVLSKRTSRECADNEIDQDSPIIKLQVLGTPMYVINDVETADDLFEKRASIYSNRYDFPPFGNLPASTLR